MEIIDRFITKKKSENLNIDMLFHKNLLSKILYFTIGMSNKLKARNIVCVQISFQHCSAPLIKKQAELGLYR